LAEPETVNRELRTFEGERGRAVAAAAAVAVGNREQKTQNTNPGTLKRYR
jgi:hypothetical protein